MLKKFLTFTITKGLEPLKLFLKKIKIMLDY